MNLLRSIRCSRVFHYSTKPSFSRNNRIRTSHPLAGRIWPHGDPKVSITPMLNQWIEEGQDVTQSQLQQITRALRSSRRFRHALEVSEWMSGERNYNLSPGDVAIRLGLISKVHGLEEAEKYFDSIPNNLKVPQICLALLNCLANNQSLDKAEVIMQKNRNRELGLPNTPVPYNIMLTLYLKMGKHEKLGALVQEMEERGIFPDSVTYNIRLNAYASTANLEEMEKLLMKMEVDTLVTMDWFTYAIAAKGYLKAGLPEKVSMMLKRVENCIVSETRRRAYETLLTLYSAIEKKDEVYRIWDLYKTKYGSYNSGYLTMISSLLKLDDINGVEMISAEWRFGCNSFDIRIPSLLINAYCNKGLLDKAEAVINTLIVSGKEPDAFTWDKMAAAYRFHSRMDKAVVMMKKAMLANRPRTYIPNRFTVAACFEYLKEKDDAVAAKELLRLLHEQFNLPTAVHDGLMDYINSRNPSCRARDLIKWGSSSGVQVEGE